MKPNLFSTRILSLAATLVMPALATHAQNVIVNGTISDTPLGGGDYAYTLTLNNTGSEAVDALWFGWTPGYFYISSPASPGNSLGWSSSITYGSFQFGGTSATAIQPGHSGTFTFDSSTTPAAMRTDSVSWAYGVNTAEFGSTLNSDIDQFTSRVVPEPSTLGLLAAGSLGLLGTVRRKTSGQ